MSDSTTSKPPSAGIIRPARRPPGWHAPGPAPRGPAGRADLVPGAGEDLCHLLGDWRIFQRTGGHRWSLDDLVTAWLAQRLVRSAPPRRILDLGCGIESVVMMLAWHFPEAELLGLEAQAISVGLARRSLTYNGIGERCRVLHADLRVADVGAGAWDLVTGTPPYFPAGRGTQSTAVQKAPCRFEHRGDVVDYARVAADALAPGGVFVCCHASRQRDRFIAAMVSAGLHPTRLVDVEGREGKPPLVTVGGFRRGSAPRFEPVAERLAVRDRAGQWTPAFGALRRAMGMPDRPPG